MCICIHYTYTPQEKEKAQKQMCPQGGKTYNNLFELCYICGGYGSVDATQRPAATLYAQSNKSNHFGMGHTKCVYVDMRTKNKPGLEENARSHHIRERIRFVRGPGWGGR